MRTQLNSAFGGWVECSVPAAWLSLPGDIVVMRGPDYDAGLARQREARGLIERFADAVHAIERHGGERIDCTRAECQDARAYLSKETTDGT